MSPRPRAALLVPGASFPHPPGIAGMAHAMPIQAAPRHVARPFDGDNGHLPPISAEPDFSRHYGPPIAMNRLPFRDTIASPSAISAPMAIRGADCQTFVPPPLPPPRLVPVDGPVDPTLQIKERERERRIRERYGSFGSTDSFGASIDLARRDPYNNRAPLDEGYHSMDVSRFVSCHWQLGSLRTEALIIAAQPRLGIFLRL